MLQTMLDFSAEFAPWWIPIAALGATLIFVALSWWIDPEIVVPLLGFAYEVAPDRLKPRFWKWMLAADDRSRIRLVETAGSARTERGDDTHLRGALYHVSQLLIVTGNNVGTVIADFRRQVSAASPAGRLAKKIDDRGVSASAA